MEHEREFITVILNRPSTIEITCIIPKYIYDERIRNIYEYSIECYKEHKTINPVYILEKHKDFDVRMFTELLTDIYYVPSRYKEQLEATEKVIIENYKQRILYKLSLNFKNKEIDYHEFIEQTKKLDSIQVVDKIEKLKANEILENINEEKSRIVLNNFNMLDEKLKLVQGDFLIIGATTGMGKSGFLLNLMNDLMNKYQCIYFNMEMSKSTIYKRIISIKSDIPIYSINNPSEYQKKLIENTLKEINQKDIYVEHKSNDIKTIKSLISKIKNEKKHTIVFIDHLGLTRIESMKSLYEQTTEVAKELRQICLDYDCTIIGASQLNRGAYNSEEITLSMLKDSGELENSASKVILLYKQEKGVDEIKQKMNIEIAKNRDGQTGIIQMIYDKSKQIFKEV